MEIPTDWTFKTADVADGFDQHVREQLPWYDLMSGAVAHIARHYIPDGGTVYDLGCSTGNIGKLLADTVAARNVNFIPVDNAESMRSLYEGPGEFTVADVATMKLEDFDVGIAFLFLMFVARATRSMLVARPGSQCPKGGAVSVVDKMQSAGGYLGSVMNRLTLAGKAAAGVPAAEIIKKELSLAGIQRPLEPAELPDAIKVFQFGEFSGWVMEPC